MWGPNPDLQITDKVVTKSFRNYKKKKKISHTRETLTYAEKSIDTKIDRNGKKKHLFYFN